MSSASADAMASGSDLSYGLELVEVAEERAQGKLVVREELKQRLGAVHSGVFAAIAEILTTTATGRALEADRKAVMVLSNQTSFLRPVAEGTIHALAVARHRGRTTWVWEVEFADDHGRLCVLTRMTIAVTDRPGS